MEAEVRNILVGMKRELSKGWIQGRLDDEEGVCVFGALINVGKVPIGYNWGGSAGSVKGRFSEGFKSCYFLLPGSVEERAMVMLATEVGVTIQELALWNDTPGRTVDDVVDAIDRLLLRDRPLKKNARKRIKRTAAPVAS